MSKKTGKKAGKKLGKMVEVKKPRNLELLYMAQKEVGVKDMESVLANQLEEVQVWPEIDIMELTMPSGKTADVETLTAYMEDEEDLKFMEEHQIKSVYAITVEEDALEELQVYVGFWIKEFGGLLCSDSDDFMPIIVE